MDDPDAADKDRLSAANAVLDRHYSGRYCRQTRAQLPETHQSITAEVLKQRDRLLAIETTKRLVSEAGNQAAGV